MLERMRLALRVTSHAFDSEIEVLIGAARLELIRAGVKPEKATADNDDLVTMAIRAYVLANYSNDVSNTKSDASEGYWKTFTYMLDNMRKSSGYMTEVESNE